MPDQISILHETSTYVQEYLQNNLPGKYVYHNIDHTLLVVLSAKEIAAGNNLSEEELEMLLIAAWFHDLGYCQGAEGHEQRSAQLAEAFLLEKNYNPDHIAIIKGCILATKMPQTPKTLMEDILCDADLSSLGKENYDELNKRLRIEWEITGRSKFTEEGWLLLEIEFLSKHHYHNEYAQRIYDKQLGRNLGKLRKQLIELPTNTFLPKKIKAEEDQPIKKTVKKGNSFGRGVETMYRMTYRTHINLSAIADNKANIMLSINAIIISITLPSLVPNFDNNPKLIIPTFILITTCLISIIYATLSTRPKITEGHVTKESIKNKRSNLLFFGNFYKMTLPDFEFGIKEMMEDEDFLYGSMTRDLYFLGKVLDKKYRYLRICYGVFMYGLILSVTAFILAFLIGWVYYPK